LVAARSPKVHMETEEIDAKALGLEISDKLLALAGEVIE
jgi:hypothetical protein